MTRNDGAPPPAAAPRVAGCLEKYDRAGMAGAVYAIRRRHAAAKRRGSSAWCAARRSVQIRARYAVIMPPRRHGAMRCLEVAAYSARTPPYPRVLPRHDTKRQVLLSGYHACCRLPLFCSRHVAAAASIVATEGMFVEA